MPDFRFPSIVLFFAITALTLLFAFVRGGRPEKIGGLLVVAGAIFEAVLHIFIPPRFVAIDFAGLSADLFLLGGFSWLALNARRIWPIWSRASAGPR